MELKEKSTNKHFTEIYSSIPLAEEKPAFYRYSLEYYDLGLNVFPQKFAQKGGFPWKQLRNVRLERADLVSLLDTIEGANKACNLAVILGRTSQNLFVLDCETREVFERYCKLIKQANIPLWAVRSGSGQGGHIYLRSKEGELSSISLQKSPIENLEIRSNGIYVLAPPSVHPDTGVFYTWDCQEGDSIPIVSLSDLDFLPFLEEKQPKIDPEKVLQDRLEKIASTKGGEKRRNKTLNDNAFYLGMYTGAGLLDRETVEKTLEESAVKNGYVTKRGITQVRTIIQSALNAGEEKPYQTDGIHTYSDQLIEYAENWLKTYPFTGRTKMIDTAVALALIERAKKQNGESFRASHRELAEIARCNKTTISPALERIIDSGFPCKKLNGSKSVSIYGFNRGVQFPYNAYTCSNSVRNSYSDSNEIMLIQLGIGLDKDTIERGALGKTALLVYFGLLKYGPLFATALSKKIALSVRQITYGIRHIRDIAPGLIKRTEKGYIGIADPEELERTVKHAHTTRDKRRQKHEKERAKNAYSRLLSAVYEYVKE